MILIEAKERVRFDKIKLGKFAAVFKWYEEIINSGQNEQNSYLENKRIKLINIVVLYIIPILLIYAVLNIQKNIFQLAYIDLTSVILITTAFFYIKIKKDIHIASLLIILALYVVLIGILFHAGIANASFFWFFLFPLFTIFLLGTKKGLLPIYILLVSIALFYIYSSMVKLELTYDKALLIVLVLALVLETILVIFYEKIRQSYESTINEQKYTYETLFAKSGDAILIIKNERFIDCNETTVKLLKYNNKKQFLNTHPSLLSPEFQPDGRSSFEKSEEMIQTAIDNHTHHFEWVHTKATGEDFWAEVLLTPISLNGEDVIHVVWRDISDRKKVEYDLEKLNRLLERRVQEEVKKNLQEKLEKEEAYQANKEKSKFLANMSHEIRTPLNAIMGFIDVLREDEKDPEKLKYLNTINNSNQTLINIINDILDFSKIESGKLEIEKVNFDLHEEITSITNLYQAKCKEKNIRLDINFDNYLPKTIYSDPHRLKQIAANLLSNAIKFSETNTTIKLNIKQNSNRLKISVIDNGIGIAKDKQKKIFEGFSQADNSTTRKFGGTGLGLSISLHLIKLLGGELKLNSREGEGSKFYFYIPLELGKCDLEEKNKNTIKKKIDKLTGKILLVEDNKANQMLMGLILKKLSLKYDIANDGLEAIEAFKKKKYDVILMDENMPNLNGSEATKEIIKLEKMQNLTHTPIFALTANALKGDKERFIDAGMDEYLTKPIDRTILVDTLYKYLY